MRKPLKRASKNQLFLGDCLEIMPTLPSQSVNMILCDLPYGTTRCKWDTIIPLVPLWEEYKRLLREDGVIALTSSQPFTTTLISSNLTWYKHEWIWVKNRGSNFGNTVREPMKEHESVLVFASRKWNYRPIKELRHGGGKDLVGKLVPHHSSEKFESTGYFNGYKKVLEEYRVPSSVQKFNCEVGLHPTQKPVALFEYLVKTYTDEGMTVLDNCAGSGTTGVACKNLNRNSILIEKDPTYFNTMKDRLHV